MRSARWRGCMNVFGQTGGVTVRIGEHPRSSFSYFRLALYQNRLPLSVGPFHRWSLSIIRSQFSFHPKKELKEQTIDSTKGFSPLKA